MEAILYTRIGCHLCDVAKEILVRYRIAVREVDIDTDAELSAELKTEYDLCVPVVEIDGKVRFRGRIDEVLLKRLLRERR